MLYTLLCSQKTLIEMVKELSNKYAIELFCFIVIKLDRRKD